LLDIAACLHVCMLLFVSLVPACSVPACCMFLHKLGCVCAEMHALWRVCIAVYDIYCRILLDIAACLHVCMLLFVSLVPACSVPACCMFLHKCGGVRNGVGSVHADELLHKCGGIVFADVCGDIQTCDRAHAGADCGCWG